MSYDHTTACRVRDFLLRQPTKIVEKKMFGGVGFLLSGNLCFALWEGFLIVRVGPQAEALLQEEHVHPFDLTGRAMTGWVMVAPDGIDAERDFQRWLMHGIDFAASLPPKELTQKKRQPKKKRSSAPKGTSPRAVPKGVAKRRSSRGKK